MSKKLSFPKEKIKILLLEDVHTAGVQYFKENGYGAQCVKTALFEKELIKALAGVHILGIRSKTQVTPAVLKAAPHLLAVGCFCIGTNQVALEQAARSGVVVFNAPYSNTRSVAELAMAEIVMLARRASHKSALLHEGVWEKSAKGCMEVRHKTLGIVGYGHIGPQIGLLAESFGMKVLFHDITAKLPLGNAAQVKNLKELLQNSDFVSLHVPETPLTKNMIGAKEIACMKRGSFLLNLARGTVVDIPALAQALKSGHLAGAGLDVFPEEPASNDEPFESELRGLDNVILTPHIGGSTEEAQKNIGIEVSSALTKYLDTGTTTGAVNFPQVELPVFTESHRILNIHRNVPGVLSEINSMFAALNVNIQAQVLQTRGDVGYLIMDVERSVSGTVKTRMEAMDSNIRTRLLY